MFVQDTVEVLLGENIKEGVQHLSFDHEVILGQQLVSQRQEGLNKALRRNIEFGRQAVADDV